MDMLNQKEWIFYAVVGMAVLFNEITLPYGVAICTFLPLMGCVLAVGFWTFPPVRRMPSRNPESLNVPDQSQPVMTNTNSPMNIPGNAGTTPAFRRIQNLRQNSNPISASNTAGKGKRQAIPLMASRSALPIMPLRYPYPVNNTGQTGG